MSRFLSSICLVSTDSLDNPPDLFANKDKSFTYPPFLLLPPLVYFSLFLFGIAVSNAPLHLNYIITSLSERSRQISPRSFTLPFQCNLQPPSNASSSSISVPKQYSFSFLGSLGGGGGGGGGVGLEDPRWILPLLRQPLQVMKSELWGVGWFWSGTSVLSFSNLPPLSPNS